LRGEATTVAEVLCSHQSFLLEIRAFAPDFLFFTRIIAHKQKSWKIQYFFALAHLKIKDKNLCLKSVKQTVKQMTTFI
jgi:hypothetical protein